MTLLAAAIMVDSESQALAQAALAAERGADIVEYRIDRFADDFDAVVRIVQQSPLPCIVTCRPEWEGGEYDGDEMHRVSLIEHLVAGQGAVRHPAYIDVELAAWQRSANLRQKVALAVDHPDQQRPIDTGLILSSHDFTRRPADLFQKIEAMAREPACRVIKVAWLARSLRDNVEAFELLCDTHKPTIALCMGQFGLPSRVLAKKFGALLTFAGIDDDALTAPGQVGLTTMKRLYRWDDIDIDTLVYGVIGYPVAHSKSPHIMNRGFEAVTHNGVYLPLPIPPEYEHFKATMIAWLHFKPLHFRGASVTIPHKENLIRFVTEQGGEVDPLAARIGAANTLAVRENGSLYASNTDCLAAIDSLCAAMGVNRDGLRDTSVGVIGAGGAARAIVTGLVDCGANVTVYNRTLDRAEQLVADVAASVPRFPGPSVPSLAAAALDALPASRHRIYINCTPIGMSPDIDATPLPDPPAWGRDTIVFDTIYNPLETRLLREARAAGCVALNGLDMFVRQAAAQFELWTCETAPRELFEKIVRGEAAR